MCPGEEKIPLQGLSFWESQPPMGLPESATGQCENQEGRRKPTVRRRPRARRCLLKGCERQFHPVQARQRYCSPGCREAARRWARWKAQQRYRETAGGKQKRNGQGRRYRAHRERERSRKPPEPEAVEEAARVIPTEEFFRSLLPPAGLLPELRAAAAKSFATFLLGGMPARVGAREAAGAALERGAHLIPTY